MIWIVVALIWMWAFYERGRRVEIERVTREIEELIEALRREAV